MRFFYIFCLCFTQISCQMNPIFCEIFCVSNQRFLLKLQHEKRFCCLLLGNLSDIPGKCLHGLTFSMTLIAKTMSSVYERSELYSHFLRRVKASFRSGFWQTSSGKRDCGIAPFRPVLLSEVATPSPPTYLDCS